MVRERARDCQRGNAGVAGPPPRAKGLRTCSARRAQHPGGLFVLFQQAGQEIGGAGVVGHFRHFDALAQIARQRLVIAQQRCDHGCGIEPLGRILQARQRLVLGETRRRP